MQNCINAYNSQDNTELEFRIKFESKKEYSKLISKFANYQETKTLSINFFNDDITTIAYFDTDGKKLKTEARKKTRLANFNHPLYKLVTALEIPVKEENLKNVNSMCRMKYRLSYIVEDWRHDITIVYSSPISMLKTNVKKFFVPEPPFQLDSVIFEYEIECLKKPIDLAECKSIVQKYIGTTHGGNENAISEIANLLQSRGKTLKQIAHPVIQITNSSLQSINIDDYCITDKADGLHAFIYISNNQIIGITSLSADISQLKDSNDTIIIDCEKVDSTYYCYDLLYYNELYTSKPFNKRYDVLKKVCATYKLPIKQFFSIEKNTLSKFKKAPYEIDGFILTPQNYEDKFYKLKFAENLTIDFLLKLAPPNYPFPKKEGFDTYLLFCGISGFKFKNFDLMHPHYYHMLFNRIEGSYFPTLFKPSFDNDIHVAFISKLDKFEPKTESIYHKSGTFDGYVCEMKFNLEKYLWDFVKVRDDRIDELNNGHYFGNDFKIAESTLMQIIAPITYEDLFNGKKGYFKVDDSGLYDNARKFNSSVKHSIIEEIRKPYKFRNVLDIGSGKGQDILKIAEIANSCVFSDLDIYALQQLVERKESLKTPLRVFIEQIDYSSKCASIVERLKKYGKFDLINSSLAIHYFTHKTALLNNFYKTICEVCAKNGLFVYTIFDGDRIIECLKKHSNNWTIKKDGKIKYSIICKDKNPTYGSEISVVLPFTNGEYYKEHIVSIDNINRVFDKSFTVVHRFNFGEMSNNELDPDDYEFVNLYGGSILEKMN